MSGTQINENIEVRFNVDFCYFYFHSRRSRPPSWAVTSQQMTNTSWQDLVTRRPPSTRSSTREKGGSCSASALLMRWLLHHPCEDYDRLRSTNLENLTGGNRWRCRPKDSCAGKSSLFFSSFLFWRVYFLVTLFSVNSESLGVTRWSGASFLRTSFPRRLVKSVHIGLNKRHFIYTIKIYIYFHVLGVLVMICFWPTLSYAMIFEWRSST